MDASELIGRCSRKWIYDNAQAIVESLIETGICDGETAVKMRPFVDYGFRACLMALACGEISPADLKEITDRVRSEIVHAGQTDRMPGRN